MNAQAVVSEIKYLADRCLLASLHKTAPRDGKTELAALVSHVSEHLRSPGLSGLSHRRSPAADTQSGCGLVVRLHPAFRQQQEHEKRKGEKAEEHHVRQG